jgi:carbon-monoxide dehydrogenase medium subunit
LALDAQVALRSAAGSRTVPLHDFFVDIMQTAIRPDELVTEVVVPAGALSRRSAYVKFAPRSRDDYPTVGVAVSVGMSRDWRTIKAVRIAAGGVAPTAVRLTAAEDLLCKQPVEDDRIRAAGLVASEHASPWDDARGSATYKRAMLREIVTRVVHNLTKPKEGACGI